MNYRKFESRDRIPVYEMFRTSLWDYLMQVGLVQPDEKPDFESDLNRQQNLYVHLEQHASEDWVAEDESGNLLGWARSVERDDHLQLTHFFVSPDTQGKGVGRALLDLAFPPGRGGQRSVIATTNSRALSLYLRYGVTARGMALSIHGTPEERELATDLVTEQATPSEETLAQIVEIDARVLGYRRPVDLEFFMQHQPLFLFRRNGQVVGYAFGSNGNNSGPAAALEAEDLPALLHRIDQHAFQQQQESLWLTIPAAASHALNWALESGYRIDPFYEVLLVKNPSMQFDRYLMTESAFIW